MEGVGPLGSPTAVALQVVPVAVGRQRRDLFISYIAALERHELKLPRLDPFYREHKYCRVDDLFGKGHPPDTVVAMALAYHAFRTGRQPGDYGVTI